MANVTVTISKGERGLQTFLGWEISSYLGQDLLTQVQIDTFSPTLISFLLDSNVTDVRVAAQQISSTANITGLDMTTFDSDMNTFWVPFKAAALARGMTPRLILEYVTFGSPDQSLVYRDDPTGYGNAMAAVVSHMNSTWGVVPNYLSPLLEPDFHHDAGNTTWYGWTGAKLAANYLAARTAIATAGFTPPLFVGPDVNDQNRMVSSSTINGTSVPAYVDDVMGAGGMLAAYVFHFGDHTYVSTGNQANVPIHTEPYKKESGVTESFAPTSRKFMDQLVLEKAVYGTMYVVAGINTTGSNTGNKPTCTLQNNATVPTALVGDAPTNGSQLSWYYVVDGSTTPPTVTLCDTGKRAGAFQGAIKPGAVQQWVTFSDSSRGVAYSNPDGTWGVVIEPVTLNTTFDITGAGWPAGDYTVRHLAGTNERNITTDITSTVTIGNGGTISTVVPNVAYDLIVIKSAAVPTTKRGTAGASFSGSIQ